MWTLVSESVKHANAISKPITYVRQLRHFASYRGTDACMFTMKPGTPIPGLDIYKERDPVCVLERSEYPDWVDQLSTPLPTLGELRRLPESEASDRDKIRYLKLTRRIQIKKNSAQMSAQKK